MTNEKKGKELVKEIEAIDSYSPLQLRRKIIG